MYSLIMTRQLPFKTFIIWMPQYRALVISYAYKADYEDYAESLELAPHYNDDQTYLAVQRHMDHYLRTEGEKVILGRAIDWADMELLRITREHWAWKLRQRIARMQTQLDSLDRANKRSQESERETSHSGVTERANKHRNRKRPKTG